MTYTEGKDCTTWDIRNSYLHSGTSTEELWYISELIIPAKILKPGNLTIEYQKDSRMDDYYENGDFSIYDNK